MTTNILSFLSGTVAEKFEANFRAQRTDSFAKFITEYDSKEEAVISAFYWGETPEGFEFWEMISDLWMKFLEEGGEPIPENPNIEISVLKCCVKECIEKDKLSVDSVLKAFGELFGDKVFRAFETNVKYYPSVEDAVRSLIDTGSVSNLVGLTFSWIGSPEGREYWSQISDMWEEYWEAKTGMKSEK